MYKIDIKKVVEDGLELRMYYLVMYNISPIQQGIQAGHAVVEYQSQFPDSSIYRHFAECHKTFILLNGGSSITQVGHYNTLLELGVPVAKFHEPDLNGSLSAMAFILDSRVFDKKRYPDPVNPTLEQLDEFIESIGGEVVYAVRKFVEQFRLA